MVEDDQFGVGADGILHVGRVEHSIRRTGYDGQCHALLFQPAQGAHDGVVFHAAGDDVVAGCSRPRNARLSASVTLGPKTTRSGSGALKRSPPPGVSS